MRKKTYLTYVIDKMKLCLTPLRVAHQPTDGTSNWQIDIAIGFFV